VEEPADAQWQRSFGLLPERDTDIEEAWVRAACVEPQEGETLRVSWDLHGNSVRLRWSQGDRLRLDLYREGVYRLSIIDQGDGETRLRVDYQQDDLQGVLTVQVWPHFTCTDSLLHAM
jgi:YD repeat-containing protein